MFANFHSKSPINFSGYNNAEVDRLLLIGRTSLDERKRKAAYCDLIKIMNDDVVWLWTGSRTSTSPSAGPTCAAFPRCAAAPCRSSAAWLAE